MIGDKPMPKEKFKGLSGKRKDKPTGISEKVINIQKIIELIKRGSYPSVDYLAEECEVSRRSILRYIRIIESVKPLAYDRKKKGYIFENDDDTKIPLKTEELAIVAALSDMTTQVGEPIKGYFKSVLNRLYSCTDTSIMKKDSVINFMISESGVLVSKELFETISDAIRKQRQLKIEYKAVNKKQSTDRIINPYTIVFHEGIWHLYAHCHLRNSIRCFSLDRIKSLDVLNETFKKPDNFDIEENINKNWGIWQGKETTVKVIFYSKVAEYVTRKKLWHSSEKRKILPNGDVELTFKVSGTFEIKFWINSWIPNVKVIEPKELIEEIKRDLKESLLFYE